MHAAELGSAQPGAAVPTYANNAIAFAMRHLRALCKTSAFLYML